jgi:hypothetical protein
MNQCSRSVVIIDQTLILIIAAGSKREQSSETAIRNAGRVGLGGDHLHRVGQDR